MKSVCKAIALGIVTLCAGCGPGLEAADPSEIAGVDQAASNGVMRLEPLWLVTGFNGPESAARSPDGTFLVSNINYGGPDRLGQGYISQITADGKPVKRFWAKGLDAPKGLAVLDGILYAADMGRIARFDISNGTRLDDVPVDPAAFLNDVTVWDGAVFVSNPPGGSIYRVDGDQAELWLADDRLAGVNGLLGDGSQLLIATMNSGTLFRADTDAALVEIAGGMPNADGIGRVPGEGFLVSSWKGLVYFVSEDGTVTTLIDNSETQMGQNDLGVFGDIVVIPNLGPGTVTGWRLPE